MTGLDWSFIRLYRLIAITTTEEWMEKQSNCPLNEPCSFYVMFRSKIFWCTVSFSFFLLGKQGAWWNLKLVSSEEYCFAKISPPDLQRLQWGTQHLPRQERVVSGWTWSNGNTASFKSEGSKLSAVQCGHAVSVFWRENVGKRATRHIATCNQPQYVTLFFYDRPSFVLFYCSMHN